MRNELIGLLIKRDCRLRTARDWCTGEGMMAIMTRYLKESRALIVMLLSEHEAGNFQARVTVRVAVQKRSEAQVPPASADRRSSECARHINNLDVDI